jgi:hypothetical protein
MPTTSHRGCIEWIPDVKLPEALAGRSTEGRNLEADCAYL